MMRRFTLAAVVACSFASTGVAQDSTTVPVNAVPPARTPVVRKVAFVVGTQSLPFRENGAMIGGELRIAPFVSIGGNAGVQGGVDGELDVSSGALELSLRSFEASINVYPQRTALRSWVVSAGVGRAVLEQNASLVICGAGQCTPSRSKQTRQMISLSAGHQWIIGTHDRYVAGFTAGVRRFLGSAWRSEFDYTATRPLLSVRIGVAL
jgi:hypothetical protein